MAKKRFNPALVEAANEAKKLNEPISITPQNDFEVWARSKGMLIDKENGCYKSLETRAYADTWHHAQAELLSALEGLFENCAMIHNSWGDGNNAQAADAAIEAARSAVQKARGDL